MQYPVDILAAVSQAELQQSAQSYMTELLYSNPECPEQLTLPDSTQLVINISTVGLVPLYGSCDTHKILALFAPADPFTPSALYLLDKWWTVSDILRTADTKRNGVVQVDTLGERIILYVLNRIVYRVQEMSSDELPFLCHGEKDYAKILWRNGEAVGFYSVKATGSSCSSFSSRTYPLPVMDSMFVRKHYRGNGLGLRMLEDYVDSFKEDCLGLRYPLTTAMYRVCECYLRAFPGNSELLWEVDSSRLDHRTTIASKIQSLSLRAVSRTLTYSTQSSVPGSVHHTEETVEEVTIVKATKGSRHGTAGQKHTEEQSHSAIRISEEVTLSRLEQNSEVVQTEELLNVTTENGTGIAVTELEEETLFYKVTSLQRSEEDSVTLGCAAKENVPENLNTLCSSVMTVENVASETENCSHTPEHDTEEELSHKTLKDTAPPQGLVSMERVLRTVVNIPLPSTVGEGEADADKPVGESEITEETKNKEVDTAENQAENAEEETPEVHEKTLRGRRSATTFPRPTGASKRHKKAEVSAAEEDAREHESDLVQEKDKEYRVEEHAAADRVGTVEETALEDSMTAEDARKEQNKEAMSIAATSLDTNILSDTKNTEHTGKESTLDLDRKSQTETILGDKDRELNKDVEQDLESLPKVPVPLVETSALKSGPKILTSTIRCRCAAGKQESQQKTIDRPKNEHKNILDAKSETTTKKSSSKSTGDQEGPDSEELSSEKVEAGEVVEPRVLRSGARTVSGVSTPRSTRSRKQKAEEDIVETTAVKRGRTSTGRKQVSRPDEPAQELKTSSAERDATEGAQAQQQTPDHALSENAEMPLPTAVDKDGVSKNEPETNSEAMVLTETKAKEAETPEDTAAEEDRKQQEPALVEEDTLEAKTEDTMEETAVAESTGTEAAEEEKREEAADVAHVPLSTAEAEDTEQAESSLKMDKESQPETVMERNQAEPGRDKEPEPESLQEKPEETTPSVETRSLRSGPKTLTATPRRRHTAGRQAAQQETLDRPQEEPQKEQQDAIEAQIEESVAAETPTEAVDNELAQPETKAPEEASELALSQTKPPEKAPALAPSQSMPPEEAPELAQSQSEATQEAPELGPSQTNAPDEATQEAPELAPSQTKPPEEAPEEAVANEEDLFVAVTPEVTNLSSKLDEAGEVVEPRILRSGARTVSGVPTPRTTTSRKQKAEEDTVETTAMKKGMKSTIRKQVSRPEEPAQELKTSSAEEDATEGAQAQQQTPDHVLTENAEIPLPTAVDEDGVSKNEPETNSEAMVLTETKAKEAETPEDTAAEEDRKQQEPAVVQEDTLEAKKEDTMEETAVVQNTSAEAAEEEKREEAADVALVPLSTAEAEDTEQAESSLEMDKESQPETVMEGNQAEPGRDKEPEPESLPEKPEETTPLVETRSLRSGPKTLTATPRRRHTAGRQAAQQETLDRPQEEPQKEQQDTIEAQTEKSVAAETPTEAIDNELAQPETKAPDKAPEEAPELAPSQTEPPEEAPALAPSQTKAPEEATQEAPELDPSQINAPEEATELAPSQSKAPDKAAEEAPELALLQNKPPEEAVANEEDLSVAVTPEVTNLSSKLDEAGEVVEPRVLRSGARTVSGVPTPRTTTSRKQKAEEDTVETTAVKRGRKSTIRKQVSRPEEPAQELKTSSAEEDATEGAQAQQQTPDHVPTENAEIPLPTALDEDEVSKNEPETNSEVMVLTETKAKEAETPEDTAAEEDRKQQEPAVVQEDTLEAKTEDTMEETAVAESTSAEAAVEEKREETADVALVPLSTAEAEDTEQTESTLEMDKESQPETVMEGNQAEPGRDKVPEPESLQEKLEETTPLVETRSLRSGPKTLTATPRRRHTAGRQAAQQETLDRPQEEPQNEQQDAIEAQIEESVAAETPTEAVDNELAQLETQAPDKATQETSELAQSQTKPPEEAPELAQSQTKAPEEATQEAPELAQSQTKPPEEAPVLAPSQTKLPEEAPELAQSQTRAPEEATQEAPELGPSQSKPPEEAPELAQSQSKAPEEATQEAPELGPSQFNAPEEAAELAPSQSKAPDEATEEAPEEAVASEEDLSVVVTPEVTNLSSKLDEAGEVVEPRVLRSGARTVSGVPTPRSTRSRKQKAEEDTVETTAVKRGRKSTGRKQVSRPEEPALELKTSSAEEDATEGAQTQQQTPDHVLTENAEIPLPTAVDEDGVSKNEPVENSEAMVLTETKAKEAETAEDTAAEEDRKEQEPALVEEDTLEAMTEDTMEETAVVESTSAEAAEEEKREEAADVALVPLSTAEAEDTEQTESSLKMDKESQPETVMERNQAEPGRDKEPEPESLPDKPEETTPSVETRSLRSGPKTLTATPRCRHTAGRQAAQQETLDRPQEEPQNEQQDAIEAQIEESVAAETPTEAVDNELDPAQTKPPEEASELAPSQTNAPEEAPEEAVANEEDLFVVVTPEVTNLSSKLDEAGEVVEPRVLRSGARTVSGVPTPRSTRSRKQKAEEDTVETTAVKRGRKSTGRKRVSRSDEPAQELKTSSAEKDATEGAQAQQQTPYHALSENAEMPLPTAVDKDGVSKNEPETNSEAMVLTETKAKEAETAEDTAAEEDRKEQEPALVEEDTLEAKTEDTMEETAVVESTSAEAAEEEKREETADVALVPLSTAEAEDTEQAESSLKMDKESQPETVMERNQAEPGRDKEPEPESLPEKPEETTPSVETRSLRSGPKTLTATPRRRHTAGRQAAQQETLDRPQEEPQNEQQDAIEAQIEESVAAETPTEAVDNEMDQSQTKPPEETPELAPSQTEALEEASEVAPSQSKAPEEAPEEAVANEEDLFVVVTPEVTNLSSKLDEAGEVVEPRILRSGARTVSGVPTPRSTRSRKQKAEEDTVETTAVKRGRKSTGRKQVSRPEEPAQELKASSAEKDATEGAQAQQQTPDHAPIENAEIPLPTAVDEDGVSKNEPVENSEAMVLTETKAKEAETAEDTAAEEDRKEQEPALVEEDTLEAMSEDTMEETAVVESTSAEAAEEEKREEAADVALVPLSTAESEDTEQIESSLEMDKESQPETVMEENQAEPGRDKEPEPEFLSEKSEETTLSVETRSLRSRPKTLTATPRRRHTAGRQAAQQETLDRPQEEPQNEQQDAIEAQIEESVAAETPTEAVDNELDPSQTKPLEEAPELAPSQTEPPEEAPEVAPSQTKAPEEAPEELAPSQTKGPVEYPSQIKATEEAPEEVVASEEDLSVVVTPEVTNLSSKLDEAGEVVEPRVLRSGARTVSGVPTPRTTTSRKQKAEEDTVETTAVKRGRKSTGRKQVSRPDEPAQELKTSSAEEDATEGAQAQQQTPDHAPSENAESPLPTAVDKDGVSKNEPVENSETMVLTETKAKEAETPEDTAAEEDRKEQEPALVEEDNLDGDDKQVEAKKEDTMEETAVADSISAEAAEEEKREEAADVALVPLSTAEAEDTEQTESTLEMNKESQPETVMEENQAQAGRDKEPEPESLQEKLEETTPLVETRSLRSGPKTLTATPRRMYTAGRQAAQQETLDRPQEEPQNEQQDAIEAQIEESVAAETPTEAVDNKHAQPETKATNEATQEASELAPSQTKVPEELAPSQTKSPEEAIEEFVTNEEDLFVAITPEVTNLDEAGEVVETMVLRSGDRTVSDVPIPRTSRSRKQKAAEDIFETTDAKRGRKSTGRKRVSRPDEPAQELKTSSAEEDVTEGAQAELPTNTAPYGEQTLDKDSSDKLKEREVRHQTALEVTDLPMLTVVLVDFNKVQLVKSVTEHPRPKLQENPEEVKKQGDVLSPNEEPAPEVETRLLRSRGKCVAATEKMQQSQQKTEEECSRTALEHKVDHTEDHAQEAAQGEGEFVGTFVSETSAVAQSSEGTKSEEENSRGEEQDTKKQNLSEQSKGAHTDKPEGHQGHPDTQLPMILENADSAEDGADNALLEEAPLVSTRVLHSGRMSAPHSANINRSSAKRAHSKHQEYEDEPSSPEDIYNEETNNEGSQDIVPEESPEGDFTKIQQAEAEEPHTQAEPEETAKGEQSQEELSPFHVEPAPQVETSPLRSRSKRQCLQLQVEEECLNPEEETVGHTEDQCQETKEGLEHNLETTVTGEVRADPEASAEYENKEVDEAEKAEDVSFVNTPDLQQEREAPVQKKTNGSKYQTPRRSSRKRARVDYRDNDDKQDSSESSAPEDISKSNERTPVKKKAQSRTSAPEPQSEEEEASEGVVLNLVLEEDEEQSASDEELIVIGGKVLRGRSVPSIIITPHSKSSSRRSKVHSPEGSPEQSPRHLRKRRSAEGTPVRRSKRHRD